MALTALILGVSMSVVATGRITLRLLMSELVCWSFVPLLQLFTGLVFIRGTSLDRAGALRAYFGAHRPWLLWMLVVATTLLLLPNPGGVIIFVLLSAIIPSALTFVALRRIAAGVFHESPSRATWRVLAHQAVTILIVLGYVELSVALVPRLLAVLQP